MLKTLLLVGSGGFIGSVLRYLCGTLLARPGLTSFPLGTFTVNLLGCLVIGLLAGCIETRNLLSGDARLFLMIGLLGGFTTFSSYGLETVELIRAGEPLTAMVYVLASTLGGLALAALGFWLTTVR